MIIDLNKNRREYFDSWSSGQIVRQFVKIPGNFSAERDLFKVEEDEKLVVGTVDGSLEGILDFVGQPDWLGNPQRILDMIFDELLILPAQYHVPEDQSRSSVVYSVDSLEMADSMPVKRALIEDEDKLKGRLSLKRKVEENWYPERVLTEMCHQVYLRRERTADKLITGYGWWGSKDNTRRVVSLYRNYEALIIRAFQNLAYFNELRKIRDGEKGELSKKEIRRFGAKLDKYMDYVEEVLEPYLERLKTNRWDLIEPIDDREEPKVGDITGVDMRVPSLGRKDEFINGKPDERRCYVTTLLNMPVFEPGDKRAYGAVWEFDARCDCLDGRHRGNRRRTRISDERLQGLPAKFFTKHEPAAYIDRQSWFREHYRRGETDVILEHCPFLFPMGRALQYLHKLQYQTLVVVPSDHGRASVMPLNKTTKERLLWDLVKTTNPYEEQFFTTDLGKFKKSVDDPHLGLIQFVG